MLITLYGQEKNSTMLMGANALYWVENDKLRSEPDYIENLKKLNIQTMRFPGGEVADNYDWRTNTLNNPNWWPTSKKDSDTIDRMDFNEFMRLQKKLDSEPIIVVNLENGFVTRNLEEAANIAAQWVRYANVEMGYGVKYWEIGNESNHISTRYPLGAQEYAVAFNLFAKKMKTVDPTIKLGANGPFNVKGTAIFDRLNKKNQQSIHKINNGKRRKRVAKKLLSKQSEIINMPWWDVVLEMCGDNVDFVAVHHYITIRKTDEDMKKPLRIKKTIESMKVYTKEKVGEELPIFITEWNVFKNNSLSPINYENTINEAKEEFISGGVRTIHFWPLRPTKKRKYKSMLELHKEKK